MNKELHFLALLANGDDQLVRRVHQIGWKKAFIESVGDMWNLEDSPDSVYAVLTADSTPFGVIPRKKSLAVFTSGMDFHCSFLRRYKTMPRSIVPLHLMDTATKEEKTYSKLLWAEWYASCDLLERPITLRKYNERYG